jgi:hypothetical protein
MASGNSVLSSKSGFPMATMCIILEVQKKMRRQPLSERRFRFLFCSEKLFSLDLLFDLRLRVKIPRFLIADGLAEDLFDGFGGFLARRSGDSVNVVSISPVSALFQFRFQAYSFDS